ncbi:MAG TPA: lytic transglycosylase domain-containing protein [Methylomirabilota bacterium]|nr:lytic transglycosylase domain-containing protein [Methylomirabilota bacterium]
MFLLLVLTSLIFMSTLAPPAFASSLYRLVDEDGVTHFTNAPTDPRFRRIGALSGTAQGWLRLPEAVRARFGEEIREVAARHGVAADLVEAVIRVESAFNPRAVSNKGAQGLMQLMPRTASSLGVRDAFDPRENIDGGVRHLRYLLDRYPGNVPLALAAYNAGEKAVDHYGGIPPYAETQQYVQKILGPGGAGSGRGVRNVVYRYTETDGTITLTNIPRGR